MWFLNGTLVVCHFTDHRLGNGFKKNQRWGENQGNFQTLPLCRWTAVHFFHVKRTGKGEALWGQSGESGRTALLALQQLLEWLSLHMEIQVSSIVWALPGFCRLAWYGCYVQGWLPRTTRLDIMSLVKNLKYPSRIFWHAPNFKTSTWVVQEQQLA